MIEKLFPYIGSYDFVHIQNIYVSGKMNESQVNENIAFSVELLK